MYSVRYSKQVVKFLQKQDIGIRVKVVEFFENIKDNADFGKYDVKRLKGFSNIYRLRISKFRVIFSVDDKNLLIKVIKASSRGDVYK